MFLRSKFVPALESSRIRFVQDDSGGARARWIVVGSEDDRTLAARAGGAPLLVSPEINVGALRESGADDELRYLLDRSWKAGTRDERDARIAELLALCPRARYLPMIDLDVAAGHTREEALAWARLLDPALRAKGFGVPSWHESGGTAGVHGDLYAPDGFEHPDLLEIARVIVLEVAREVGIPLLSDYREKGGRPPVVLDDTIFRREPSGRGSLWRPSGAKKNKTGIPKRPIDLDGNPVEYSPPVPAARELFDRAAAVVARQRELEGYAYGRRGRRSRTIRPVELPPGTSYLPRFAAELAGVLARGHARHEARLGSAGWLLGLGVRADVVANTLAHATGNLEDAQDVVASTVSRMNAGRPAKGLPHLQRLLGGAEVVVLREALVADGVEKARKCYWTDSERSLLMRAFRGAPETFRGRLALRDGARCGTFAMPYECEEHGPQGVRLNVEERELTCPHCREARWRAREELLREKWKADRYGVLVVRPTQGENLIRALKRARGSMKRLLFRSWRWFLAHDHVLFVFPHYDVRGMEVNLERHDGTLGVAEKPLLVSRDEAIALVGRAWRSPGVAFQGLVETGDEAAILAFPWLQRMNVVRTHSDKQGATDFPWVTAKEIRERAKRRAIEARGGVDPNVCDHEADIDECGKPIPCGRDYLVYVDHLPTGVRLRGGLPFVGRFPRKHELHLALEVEDPEVLREGYEQQRALGRRR